MSGDWGPGRLALVETGPGIEKVLFCTSSRLQLAVEAGRGRFSEIYFVFVPGGESFAPVAARNSCGALACVRAELNFAVQGLTSLSHGRGSNGKRLRLPRTLKLRNTAGHFLEWPP